MEKLIAEAEKFATHLLNEALDSKFLYHNLTHTQRVVEKSVLLAEQCGLAEQEKNVLLIAAWLHDIGYTKNIEKHEEESVLLAQSFFKDFPINAADEEAVYQLILATRAGHEPKTLSEKIIRDADCSHLGSKTFFEVSELLRKEWELTCNKKLTETAWLEENIKFLAIQHRFYTAEANALWQKRKGKNISTLLKAQKKTGSESKKLKHKADTLNLKKHRADLPERGIETMFRVTLKNHIELSNIADTKANILLSVNAIIVSLVISNLVSKLDKPSNDYLIWPTGIFVIFTVVSIILSIMATRPNVTSGKFTKEDVKNKKVNLLFFGNFHKMSLNDFEWAMGEMMQDRDYLYSSMKKDLYFLGLVLDKKYKILRLTYAVFMIGIIISVLTFAYALHCANA